MAYLTLEELKEYITILDVSDVLDDAVLENCRLAAESAVNTFCGRRFDLDATATTRLFRATNAYTVFVDDIGTSSGFVLATDDDSDGTAETTWSATSYQLEPYAHSTPTYPYYIIRSMGDRFPTDRYGRYLIHVTAKWGYPYIPAEVKQATLIMASRLFKRRSSPEGIITNAEFGMVRLNRMDPDVQQLLLPYRSIESRY